jgi:hypothetical protein
VADIAACVPALLSNIRMMYTIARYYATPEHMTRLFTKITNQMIRKCKEQVGARARYGGAWCALGSARFVLCQEGAGAWPTSRYWQSHVYNYVSELNYTSCVQVTEGGCLMWRVYGYKRIQHFHPMRVIITDPHCDVWQVTEGGKLWDQDKPALIANMQV